MKLCNIQNGNYPLIASVYVTEHIICSDIKIGMACVFCAVEVNLDT